MKGDGAPKRDGRPCPWYVSAHAVRRWQAIDRSAPRDFDAASDALIELCAGVWWDRYADGAREPKVTGTGAYLYEGGKAHGRIRLVVSAQRRAEGDRQQVVDVLARSAAGRT